jgi:ribosomal-protein-alanine N-acetyltransferase
MTRKDIPGVLEVEKTAFPLSPYSKEVYESILHDPKAYPVVACKNGEIAGNAVIWIGRDAPWHDSKDDPQKAYLFTLGVKPSFQGQKIGEQLLYHVLSACVGAGIASCTLRVMEGNIPAIHLYEKFGFQDTGKREPKHYAPEGKDGIHMELKNMQSQAFKEKLEEIGKKLKRF